MLLLLQGEVDFSVYVQDDVTVELIKLTAESHNLTL